MVIVQMGIVKYYTTRHFNRWQRKNNIPDDVIVCAADEIVSGQYEASLGNKSIQEKNLAQRGEKRRSTDYFCSLFGERKTIYFAWLSKK